MSVPLLNDNQRRRLGTHLRLVAALPEGQG